MDSPGPLSDPDDYILDLSSGGTPEADAGASRPVKQQNPKVGNTKSVYLSIHFKCCNVYAPIYKNAAGTAYAGHCPRCQRQLSVPIGPGGTTQRVFEAG